VRLSIVGSQVWLFCSEFLGGVRLDFLVHFLLTFGFYVVLLILDGLFLVVVFILIRFLVLFCCLEVFVGFVFKWVGYFEFANLLLGLGINVVPSSRMLDKSSELRFERY
jgi:hypothetical protein